MSDTNYKTALVTGASSGIGEATVKILSEEGIKVVFPMLVSKHSSERNTLQSDAMPRKGRVSLFCGKKGRYPIRRSISTSSDCQIFDATP